LVIVPLLLLKGSVAAAPTGFPPAYILREPTFSVLALEYYTWLVCNLYKPRPDLRFHFLYLFYLFIILFIMSDGAEFTILPVHLAAKVEEVTALAVATFHELVSPFNLNLY
jgi:hypothetical protein